MTQLGDERTTSLVEIRRSFVSVPLHPDGLEEPWGDEEVVSEAVLHRRNHLLPTLLPRLRTHLALAMSSLR